MYADLQEECSSSKKKRPKMSKNPTPKRSTNLYQDFKVNAATLHDFQNGMMCKVDFLLCNTFASSYIHTNPQESDTCMLLT